jgi:hypothetical protein
VCNSTLILTGRDICLFHLQKAPHTLADVVTTEWNRPYSREMAAFPAVSILIRKSANSDYNATVMIPSIYEIYLAYPARQ